MYLHVHYSEASKQWYVRLVGGNGEVMMYSEMYDSKSNAQRAADNIAEQLHVDIRTDNDPTES